MKNAKSIDMTSGNLKTQILSFAIPMFFANLIQNLYNITDKIWVGRFLGKIQLTAVGTAGPVIFLILSLSIGMAIGIAVLISQNTGSDADKESILKIIDSSLIIAVSISAIMTAAGLLCFSSVLKLMGTSPQVMEYAKKYMFIILLGTPFVFYTNAVGAILRGMGDAKTPTVIAGIASIINIALAPALIIPFGISGASIAAVFSQLAGFILSHIKIIKLRREYADTNKKMCFCKGDSIMLLKLGIPATLQQGLLSIANMMVLSIINSYKNEDISSAFWAGHSFDSLAFLPAFAIGAALSTSAGQNTGAKNIKRVNETAKTGLLYIAIINGLILMAGYFLSPYIAKIFLPNDYAAMEQTVIYLKIFCFYYLPFGLMTILNSVVQGIGNTLLPMIVTVLSVYAIRLPLANYLAYHTDFGIKGVYIGMAISPIFGFLAILIYYLSGSWKKRVEKGEIKA